jgi:hypothetical protein
MCGGRQVVKEGTTPSYPLLGRRAPTVASWSFCKWLDLSSTAPHAFVTVILGTLNLG